MIDSKSLCGLILETFINQLAGIAQLVERNLAKVEVAGSTPVSRSTSLSCSNDWNPLDKNF